MTIKNGIIYPGTTFSLTMEFLDGDTLIDPGTVQLLTIDPTGLKATYTYGLDNLVVVQKISTGVYVAALVPDKSGRWHYRWLSTAPTFAEEGTFNVRYSPFVDDLWDCPPGYGYWY